MAARKPTVGPIACSVRHASSGATMPSAMTSPAAGAATTPSGKPRGRMTANAMLTTSRQTEMTSAAAPLIRRKSGSEQFASLEAAEFLAVQLDAHPVRIAEVDAVERATVRAEVLDAGRIQLRLGRL